MAGLVKSLFGSPSVAAPQQDASITALQKQQLQTEQSRSADLAADEAAQRRALETGRVGRSLLAFAPASPSTKQATLGS